MLALLLVALFTVRAEHAGVSVALIVDEVRVGDGCLDACLRGAVLADLFPSSSLYGPGGCPVLCDEAVDGVSALTAGRRGW